MNRDRQDDRPRTNKTKFALALAAIFVVELLSSGAFGMTSMIGGSTSTDTTTTDATTTDTTSADTTSTAADTTTTTASTDTTPTTTTTPPPPIFSPKIASARADYS